MLSESPFSFFLSFFLSVDARRSAPSNDDNAGGEEGGGGGGGGEEEGEDVFITS